MWYQFEKWSVLSKHLNQIDATDYTAVIGENLFTKTSLDLVQSINTLILIWDLSTDSVVAIVIYLKHIYDILPHISSRKSLWHSENVFHFDDETNKIVNQWLEYWCLKKIFQGHFWFYMLGVVKSHIIRYILVSLPSELWIGILSA